MHHPDNLDFEDDQAFRRLVDAEAMVALVPMRDKQAAAADLEEEVAMAGGRKHQMEVWVGVVAMPVALMRTCGRGAVGRAAQGVRRSEVQEALGATPVPRNLVSPRLQPALEELAGPSVQALVEGGGAGGRSEAPGQHARAPGGPGGDAGAAVPGTTGLAGKSAAGGAGGSGGAGHGAAGMGRNGVAGQEGGVCND